jgi:hypothetical protein
VRVQATVCVVATLSGCRPSLHLRAETSSKTSSRAEVDAEVGRVAGLRTDGHSGFTFLNVVQGDCIHVDCGNNHADHLCETEESILARHSVDFLDVDLLKVAHHSATTSTVHSERPDWPRLGRTAERQAQQAARASLVRACTARSVLVGHYMFKVAIKDYVDDTDPRFVRRHERATLGATLRTPRRRTHSR